MSTLNETTAAYIAGLFDGEGSITYKQYMRKRKGKKKAYPTWNIQMEISMTDYSIMVFILETLGCGSVTKRPPHKTSMGKKMQYRWRCGYRDAYYVCKLLWPYAHVKLPKMQKIIEHYARQKLEENNVIDFQHYKMWIKGK
jgi:hypothetical protein